MLKSTTKFKSAVNSVLFPLIFQRPSSFWKFFNFSFSMQFDRVCRMFLQVKFKICVTSKSKIGANGKAGKRMDREREKLEKQGKTGLGCAKRNKEKRKTDKAFVSNLSIRFQKVKRELFFDADFLVSPPATSLRCTFFCLC